MNDYQLCLEECAPWSLCGEFNQLTNSIGRLKHCATSRKFAGSIPDGVIGNFHLPNPSDRTIALGLTLPLTEMSSRNISLVLKVAGVYG
jgi:hypothetical protein